MLNLLYKYGRLLYPLSKVYYYFFKLKMKKTIPEKIDGVKVISVGNITTGGTGKTPFVIYLSELLKGKTKIAILSRGYKSKQCNRIRVVSDVSGYKESGDEPYLLAKKTNLPVIIGKDRVMSGKFAKERYGAEVLILDDGFQYFRLKKDLSIVLIDATNPFGNGNLIPAGCLREPPENLSRADVIVITKTNLVEKEELERLKEYILKIESRLPIFYSTIEFDGVYRNGVRINETEIAGQNIFAFSGIGNHYSFINFIRITLKPGSIKDFDFGDHKDYKKRDIRFLRKKIKQFNFLITTDKDYIKLHSLKDKLLVVKIKIKLENEKDFINILENLFY